MNTTYAYVYAHQCKLKTGNILVSVATAVSRTPFTESVYFETSTETDAFSLCIAVLNTYARSLIFVQFYLFEQIFSSFVLDS